MRRIRILQIFFLVFAVIIVGRSVQIQIFKDQRLEKLANRQFNSNVVSLSQRGLIYDRNGEGLAISLKVKSLFFRPEILKKETTKSERYRIASNLAQVLGASIPSILNKMNSDKGFVWVKRQLTDKEESRIESRGVLNFGDGVGLAQESKRFYPNKELASHVLGSVGIDGQGLEGLELFYEQILSPRKVKIDSNKDARGRRIFRDELGLQALEDGQTLILTIDKAVQYEAEKNLKLAIEEFNAKAGTVIVAEVESGEILAMANYPTFNPNEPSHFQADHKRNRAITDTYEPGSTFKPFIIGMSLEKGRPANSQIYCEHGLFKVGDRKISEAETHEKYEWLSYSDILKFSSNIGAAKVALDLGAEKITTLMDRLGMGSRTGIDLPGEVSGSFSAKELRAPIRIANIGFGHGFTVTPLQMLTNYLALANKGKWIQPKMVKAIVSEDPDSLEKGAIRWKLGHKFETVKTKNFFSEKIAHQVSQMLETVTQEKGTATAAQLPEWPVAGKTGTAQKVDPETKKYSHTKYMSSFIGFAPNPNPKLVALVILDEPQKKYYAGETSAPAFREVMRSSLLRLKVPPIDSHVHMLQVANRNAIHKLDHAELNPDPKQALGKVEHDEKNQLKLPDLKGLTIREALKSLAAENLESKIQVEVVGSGFLKEQVPSSDQWLQAGSKVRLIFSR